MIKKTTKKEVLNFLKSNFIMEVATVFKNKPHASVLLYYIDNDFNIYFATHGETYKSRALQENSNISLCVWEHGKMLIQADGNAYLVKDKKKKNEIFDNLAEAASKGEDFWPPLFRIGGKSYAVFRIKLKWLRALDLIGKNITEKKSPFTEINF